MKVVVTLAVATFSLLAIVATPAWANTFTVDTAADGNDGWCGGIFIPGLSEPDCTLREAIDNANTNGVADTIDFASHLNGATVALYSGELVINEDLTVAGLEREGVTVSGNNTSRVFAIRGDSTQVELRNLTITQGLDPNAGGIDNDGSLTLKGSSIYDNRAANGEGGGINNRGALTLANSSVSTNDATNGWGGGGINNYGTLTLTNSRVGNNIANYSGSGANNIHGGAINNLGILRISNSTISGNRADSGGGISNLRSLLLENSTISHNVAGSGGGGVYSRTAAVSAATPNPSVRTTIRSSTISSNNTNNAGPGGGLLNSRGLAMIENTTITGNSAPVGKGSGVAGEGWNNVRTELRNSITSANTNTDTDFVVASTNTFKSNGYNLIGDGNATGAFNKPGDRSGVSDPRLGALVDNGGTTRTHALLSGSPTIDKGNNCLAKDQRGITRPQDGDRNGSYKCDIGAFELEGPPDTARPTINRLSLKPGASTRDRTPTIRATVKDNATDLRKSNIKLYVDGRRKTNFRYSVSRNRLTYTTGRLAYKRHNVKIVARDAAGNVAKKSWRFRVVR